MDPNEQNQAQQPTQPVSGEAQAPATAPVAPQQPAALEMVFEDDLRFTITSEKVNDMRFLELYEELSENQLKIPKLLKFLLGEANYKGIYDYYESRGKKFTITKMGEAFGQLEKHLQENPDFLSL